jgi:O-antigen ligase
MPNSRNGIMKRISPPWAVLMTLGLLAIYFEPVSITVLLAALLLWCLRGPMACIQSLTLATLLTYINPAIAAASSDASVLARLTLIVAAARVLPSLQRRTLGTIWPAWAFVLLAAVLSTVASSSVPISIMKVVTFAIAVTTVLAAYAALSSEQIHRLQGWYATLAAILLLSAVLTLAVPRVAYFRNGTGLQGILNHPQALATLLAPLAATLVAGLVLVRPSLRLSTAVAAALCIAVIALTESRTGMAAALLGVGTAVITQLIRARGPSPFAGRGRVVAILGVIGALFMLALAMGRLQDVAHKFAFKRAESHEVAGAFFESRGDGILSEWQNFVDQPWMGHGFGVYAQGPPSTFVVEAFGIPLSAPVEKGFVFTAVLEETGVFGGLFFAFFLATLAREVWRNEDPRWIAVFASCIAVNIGEAVILAPGGIGLIFWLLIGLAAASARSNAASTTSAAAVFRVLYPNLLRP